MAASGEGSPAGKHVVVFAFPFSSHVQPLLHLVQRMSATSPATLFSFFSSAKSNRANFDSATVGAFPNIVPYDVSDGAPEGYVPQGETAWEAIELYLDVVPENYLSVLDMAERERGCKVGCLVTDAFCTFAVDVAREMRVPWIPVWIGGPIPLLVHVEADSVRRVLESAGSEDKTLDFIPGCSALRVVDLPLKLYQIDSSFPRLLHRMGQVLPQAAAVVVSNIFENLSPLVEKELRSKVRKFLSVGPLMLACPSSSFSDEYGCIPWLDKQKPVSVIYISFGTVAKPPRHEITALAEALEETDSPFLWSFRGNVEEALPRSFLKKIADEGQGKIVPWTPQMEALKHRAVGTFVSHGGWKAVLESMLGGVPMIGRPFFGDQMLNVRAVEVVWRIGVGIEGGVFTKSATIEALKRVSTHEGEGKGMRDRLGELRELALKAVKPEGSSTKNFMSLMNIINE